MYLKLGGVDYKRKAYVIMYLQIKTAGNQF